MKLYVDDIRNAPDESWTVARSINSAISFIAKFGKEISHISIDHDISHQVAIGSLSRPYPCEETFRAVAYFIGEKYRDSGFDIPSVIIHSSNPAGCDEIYGILTAYNITPEIKMTGIANRLEMEI